ncbi:integrase, partial [Rhizobium laguerreae]|nr:integrase [Rhizobium laguerreae]
YRPSLRHLPDRLPEPDYPAEAAVRRVRSNGEIKWNGDLVYVAAALAGEVVAIEESEAGSWTLRFHAHPLGIIDRKTKRLVRPSALQPRPAGAGADTGLKGGEL